MRIFAAAKNRVAMQDFFLGSGTGHSLMVLMFVIGIGLLLGKIKIGRVALGPVWILFIGIAVSALGMKTDTLFLHFMKEFGLVLFVFSVGLQVGPGFFSSFRGRGWKLNLLSLVMVLLSVVCFFLISLHPDKDLPQLVGVLSGAVTSAPALGTAQQTYYDVVHESFLNEVKLPWVGSGMAGAFSVAYLVGMLCVLLVLFFFRKIFRKDLHQSGRSGEDQIETVAATVVNPSIFGLSLEAATAPFPGDYVVTSLKRGDVRIPVSSAPILEKDDVVIVDVARKYLPNVELIFGHVTRNSLKALPVQGELVSRRVTVTKPSLTGRRLGSLDLLHGCGVTVSKVNRSGVSLIAREDLLLQVGDTLTVLGGEAEVKKAAALVGNSNAELEKPNLIPVFLGIALGLIVGAVPIKLPGMHHAIRLGLAGGCLVVSILLGHFGPRLRISTYTSGSASRMIRRLGLSLMLGAIGLGAGGDFPRLFAADGAGWILDAALIAVVPALATGLIARLAFKLNFSEICGLLAGASTNAEMLSAMVDRQDEDGTASESYATVYPVSMFLRVLAAVVIILVVFA